LYPPFRKDGDPITENLLNQMHPPAGWACEALKGRVEDLENKVEDMEAVLAALLPLPKRRSRSLISWLRSPYRRTGIGPGSTITPEGMRNAGSRV